MFGHCAKTVLAQFPVKESVFSTLLKSSAARWPAFFPLSPDKPNPDVLGASKSQSPSLPTAPSCDWLKRACAEAGGVRILLTAAVWPS